MDFIKKMIGKFTKNEEAASLVSSIISLGAAVMIGSLLFATLQTPLEQQITDLNNTDAATATDSAISFVWIGITLAGIMIVVVVGRALMANMDF
jgi:flagellar biosynthesis protein FlhB